MSMHKARMIHFVGRILFGSSLCALVGLSAASAEDAAAFYRSHALTLGVPNGPGGTYDLYMRALSRHLSGHIPGNPAVVVQNVPAAGGMALANTLYSTAARDGSYIGMVRGTVIQEQVYKDPQVHFDATKLNWIANMNSDHDTCIVWAATPIHSIDDFYTHETIVGSSGVGAQSYSFPKVYKELLGMKFKIITGYEGTPQRILAMERGEITGACGISTSSLSSGLAQDLEQGKIRLIAQAGAKKDPRYPNVPNILDQAKTPEIHQALEFLFGTLDLGRPIAAPPGVPQDRLAVLSKGVMDTLKDPEFLADSKKIGLDMDTADAAETKQMVDHMFATPPSVVARVEAALKQ